MHDNDRGLVLDSASSRSSLSSVSEGISIPVHKGPYPEDDRLRAHSEYFPRLAGINASGFFLPKEERIVLSMRLSKGERIERVETEEKVGSSDYD